MKKVNEITVLEANDPCALHEYSAQLEKDINKKFQDEKYDDTEIKQDISNIQEEQTVQNTKLEGNTAEIATLKAEKERLQQENEDLRNAAPSGQASGENLTLEDSAEMRLKRLKNSGNSWQETRSGNNLLNAAKPDGTNMVNTSFNNEILTISSTATNTTPFARYEFAISAGDIIRLNAVILDANGQIVTQLYNGTQWVSAGGLIKNYIDGSSLSSVSYESTEGYSAIRFLFYSNNSIPTSASTSRYKNIIVTRNNADMSYEQYGAMPSMEFQSQIRACGDNVNLLQNTLTSRTINGLDFDVKEDKTIVVNGTATKDSVIELATFNRKRKIYAIGNAEDSK